MKCIKCKKEIPDGSLYCNHCGKKQTAIKLKTHKRAQGSGTIRKDTRNKKQWIAYAPAKSNRKRIYLGAFYTRLEAQKAIDDHIANGRPELYKATFRQMYELWSAAHFNGVSEHAVSLYTSMWKRFAEIENVRMQDIRTADLQEIVNQCTSRSAAQTIRTMASMICKYAMENDVLSKNYAEFVKIPKFEKKEKRIFTPEEISILWQHTYDKRVQIILFMIYTGLRIGEIASLRPADVHLDEGYMICGEKTEAGRNRLVPFPKGIPELKVFLSGWMKECRTEAILGLTVKKIREKVFYPALEQYGIDQEHKLTPHSTRHTFASLCAQAGMRPENLQKIIGHARYSTTADVYIHKNSSELIEEMDKLTK